MKLEGPALRLTIFIGEDDHWHHKPLYSEIVHRAHRAGLAGASVLRGIEGYGASSRIHTSRILSLSDDLPLAIIIVDAEDKIRAFLPQLDDLVAEGLVIIDPVEVIRYVGRPPGTGNQAHGDCPAHRPRRGSRGASTVSDRPGRAGTPRLGLPVGDVHRQRHRIGAARVSGRTARARRGRDGRREPRSAVPSRRTPPSPTRRFGWPGTGPTCSPRSTPPPASSPLSAPLTAAWPSPRAIYRALAEATVGLS